MKIQIVAGLALVASVGFAEVNYKVQAACQLRISGRTTHPRSVSVS